MDIKIKSSTEMYRNFDIDANKAGIEHKRILMTGMGDVLNAIQKGKISIDGDTFEISEEARTAMQEAFDKAMADQAKVNEMNAALHDSVWAEQTGDAEKKMMDDEAKVLEIARRIGKGGIVPAKDEAFLIEKSPDLYKMAKLQALMAKEYERHKSLLEENDEPKEYDWEKGQDDTLHRVEVDVAIDGENMCVEGISEVAVSRGDISD